MKIADQVTLNLELTRPSETVPVWVSSDTKVCKVEAGGNSAKVTAVGLGKTQVIARTNCDFGSGVREHTTAFDIVVDGNDAKEEKEVVVEEPKKISTTYWNDVPE